MHGSQQEEGGESPVVLVTGCAQGGIGYEYCKAFANLNCRVIPTEIPARLPNAAADKGAFHDWLPLDVSSDASVSEAVSHVLATYGRIDVVVNNAGVGNTGPLAEQDLASVRRAWEVNALGQLRVAQAVAPHMVAHRSGRIVNVGSVVGNIPTPWAGSYCASKAAAHAMTDVLRVELKPFGVHVIKVVPGAVRSGIGRHNLEGLEGKEWKIYGDFKEAMARRANASQTSKATDADEFARHVARRVLCPQPPREIVYGHMTGLFAVLAWTPLWARDLFFSRHFGLDKTV